MDYDSSMNGRSTDRPITRWKRERENSAEQRPPPSLDRPPSGLTRPQSKMDRPISRRGIKTESWDFKPMRLPTGTPKSGSFRAAPSNLSSNQVSLASPTSRTEFGPGGPVLTNFTSQPNHLVFDRPSTQQSHSAYSARPNTARGLLRGLSRQSSRDQKYPEGSIHYKIRELNQEIAMMKQEMEYQSRERTALFQSEQKIKEISNNMIDLENSLQKFDEELQQMTEQAVKETIEREMKNGNADYISSQDLDEMQKRISENVIQNMNEDTKNKYDVLTLRKIETRDKINQLGETLNGLQFEKAKLEQEISESPDKNEGAKLHVRILEAESKRDKLIEKEKSLLTPDKEKQQIFNKIKRDVSELAQLRDSKVALEKRIMDVDKELKSLDGALGKNQSKRQLKFSKLNSSQEAQSLLKKSEEEIIEALKRISTKFNQISVVGMENPLTQEEGTALNQLMKDYIEETASSKSVDKLKQDSIKIQAIVVKLDAVENDSIEEQSDKKFNEEQIKELQMKYKELVNHKVSLNNQLENVIQKYNTLMDESERNEMYLAIVKLKDKLYKMNYDLSILEEASIVERLKSVDISKLKSEIFTVVDKYNKAIIADLKSSY